MSFFTSLEFYRPGPPPKVTGDDLARFAAAVDATGLLAGGGLPALQVKFGRAIDQDEEPATREVEMAPGICTYEDIDWDVDELRLPGRAELIARLKGESRCIYRAFASLEGLSPEAREPITRRGSPENKVDLTPFDLGLKIGPVELCSLSSDCAVYAGWMALSFSGPGYMYPWTLKDWVARAEASPAIGRLTALCRSTWPAKAGKPSLEAIECRREMKSLWPYEDLAKPGDWYWGVHETG